MNLDPNFKSLGVKPTGEIGTRPIYKDGTLYWYLDSKADDYPQDIIYDIVKGIVHEFCLDDLDKVYRKFIDGNSDYINLPIRVCYDPYAIMCIKHDDPEKQAEIEKDQELLKVADAELQKLIKAIIKKLEKETDFGFVSDEIFSGNYVLHIKPSKLAAFILAQDIERHININEYGKDKVTTVWLKNENDEWYLPSFTLPEVEYEYLAPQFNHYRKYGNNKVPFTVKPGTRKYVNVFSSPYQIEQYLKSINYTGEYRISVSDISNADLSKYVLTNTYISVELIEPLSDDNSTILYVGGLTKNITDVIDKMLGKGCKIEENTKSDYIDVFITIGTQSRFSYGLPRPAVLTDNSMFTKIKTSIEFTYNRHKDEFIFNRKGKPIDISEILANVSEKEFWEEYSRLFFHKHGGDERRFKAITLNNGCTVHYKSNSFNREDVFEYFDGTHVNVKNLQPFDFDKNQKAIYLLTNMREKLYYVKVEENESGLKIPSFKGCFQFFLTPEDCEKYLKEAYGAGLDTSGIYFTKVELNDGSICSYYKDTTTGKLYRDFTNVEYEAPIPMDIKF